VSTADCESARTSANTAVSSRSTGTALSNSVDHSTQRSGLGSSNDDVTQLSAVAVRINGPFRQAVLSAVYVDQETQRRRSRNIVVTGLSESDTSTDSQIVSDLCTNELGVSPTFTAVKRLSTIPNKIRPILATLQSEDEAIIIKKSAKNSGCPVMQMFVVGSISTLTSRKLREQQHMSSDAIGGKREQSRVFHT